MCDHCNAAEFTEMLQDELDEHDYGQVTGFMESVLAFAQDENHVTEDQRRGVENCIDARKRQRRPRRW